MADVYDSYGAGLDSPASSALAITPGASALAQVTRAVYIGGAGNLVVTMKGNAEYVTFAVTAGQIVPIRATHILAASTATGIVALW